MTTVTDLLDVDRRCAVRVQPIDLIEGVHSEDVFSEESPPEQLVDILGEEARQARLTRLVTQEALGGGGGVEIDTGLLSNSIHLCRFILV